MKVRGSMPRKRGEGWYGDGYGDGVEGMEAGGRAGEGEQGE